jgi:hypothetical protein
LQKKILQTIKPTIIPAIGWLIVSTILFTLPGSAFPKENWLDKIGFDKWVHIGIFIIMTVLWCWGWRPAGNAGNTRKLRRTFVIIGITCIAYGITIEFIQKYFIPNRSFDCLDITADSAGCVAGVIYSIRRYIKK